MNIPENFDVNLLRILNDSFSSNYKKEKERIGGSSIASGGRKLVLERMYGIQGQSSPKTLMGNLIHYILEQPEPLSRIISSINKQFNIEETQRISTENRMSHEVAPKKFLKALADVEANIIEGDGYLIEFKTTWMYVKEYVKEISYGNMVQLNVMLGIRGFKQGFLSVLNMRAFTATFHSWEQIWQKYGFTLPYEFNQELFDYTIEKAKNIFEHIDNEDPNLPCPEQDWECNYCAVRNQCGKIEVSCTHRDPKTHKLCSKKMHEWIECLTDNFKEEPICENCYTTKTSKRKDYKLIKYTKQYPWSDE